ncbi:MAG TPA: S49 family peptidase [Chloroflexi bacterium]|nr:S49 family peptidase [Chloroflexota bacterium]
MTTISPPSVESSQPHGGFRARLREWLAGGTDQSDSPQSSFRTLGSVLLWGLAPLLVGLWLAQLLVPQPTVGIIRLNSDIYVESVDFTMAQISEALSDPTIRAVVVQLNSPGGEVAASQQLYLEFQNLRRQMPVVGSIDGMAASGAFYVAMGTNPIYAKPSSTVGNVGAWGFIPPDVDVTEVILASGPFKLTASNRDEFLRGIEAIRQEFVETVFSQRGERMNISRVELSYGLAYSGRDAQRLGLIDHLGSEREAAETAARQAGVAHYQLVDLAARVAAQFYEADEEIEPWVGSADAVTGRRVLPPGAYLLYDIQLGGTP